MEGLRNFAEPQKGRELGPGLDAGRVQVVVRSCPSAVFWVLGEIKVTGADVVSVCVQFLAHLGQVGDLGGLEFFVIRYKIKVMEIKGSGGGGVGAGLPFKKKGLEVARGGRGGLVREVRDMVVKEQVFMYHNQHPSLVFGEVIIKENMVRKFKLESMNLIRVKICFLETNDKREEGEGHNLGDHHPPPGFATVAHVFRVL